jgi:hypothetical protein
MVESLYFQTFNNLPANQMLVDDFIDIVRIDIGVPGALRINHHDRAFFASVETTGLVDADFSRTAQIHFLDTLLGVLLRNLRAFVKAARASGISLIGAKENVLFVIWFIAHVGNVPAY